MVNRELQLSVALNVYRYYTHPFNCKVTFFLVDWSSLAIRTGNLIWVPTDPDHKQESLTPSYLLYHCSCCCSSKLTIIKRLSLLFCYSSSFFSRLQALTWLWWYAVFLSLLVLRSLRRPLPRSHVPNAATFFSLLVRPSSSPLDNHSGVAPHHKAFRVASRLLIASRRLSPQYMPHFCHQSTEDQSSIIIDTHDVILMILDDVDDDVVDELIVGAHHHHQHDDSAHWWWWWRRWCRILTCHHQSSSWSALSLSHPLIQQHMRTRVSEWERESYW